MFQRFFSKFIAGVFLLLLSPILIGIALWVRLECPGKVIYTQPRLGKGGKAFDLYKFRSMKPSSTQDSCQLTLQNDARVTFSGNILRKYRLDELPQLWNIVKGDMDWIGPRPEQKHYVDKLLLVSRSFESLYRVRPGLTSLGIVTCGYASNIEQIAHRAKYDKYYLQHRSIRLNVYIILQTIKVLWQGEGI